MAIQSKVLLLLMLIRPNTEEDSNLEDANTPSQSENNSDVTDNPSTNQTVAG